MTATQAYYEANAEALIGRYDAAVPSQLHALLERRLSAGAKALELGFGSGREMRFLHCRGVEVWGVDACRAFVHHCRNCFPERQEAFCHALLPEIPLEAAHRHTFDAVYAVAVWMHLSEVEQAETAWNIRTFLKPGGSVILSYSCTPREGDPRRFEALDPKRVTTLFENAGFLLEEEEGAADALGRGGVRWVTQLFVQRL